MLSIYYEAHLVGRIERADGGGIIFAYAPEWLEHGAAYAISTSMPLQNGEFGPGIATPWFANLLPEEIQLERIGRLLGRSQGDVYGILEEVGRDTAGALSIGAPEPPDNAHYRELSDPQLADAIGRLPQRPLLVGEEGMTMSLAGAQSKLTVAIFDEKIMLPLEGAASTHILKPESSRLVASVENELLCMTLAAAVALPVPSVTMGCADDKKFLLVERYDRLVEMPRRVHRGHQEDFCQALSIYPTNKYEKSGGPTLPRLFSALNKYARQPARERLALLDYLIFACSIGDTDRHGKNYSLLLTGSGSPRLAPGYDFMSSLLYDNITRNLAMNIGGKNRADHIERRHWEGFAADVGLAPAATVRRVGQLATAVAKQVTATAQDLSTRYSVNKDALVWLAEKIRAQAERVAGNSQRNTVADHSDKDDENRQRLDQVKGQA